MASTPVTQSLLGRIISALTPVSSRDILSACETGTPANSSQRYETPSRRGKYISDSQGQSVVSLSSRKRKRRDQENCDPESNAIEMKEILSIPEKHVWPSSSFSPNSYPIFSPSLSIPVSFCFRTDSCGGSVETLSSKLVGSPMAESEVTSPVVRRSERVEEERMWNIYSRPEIKTISNFIFISCEFTTVCKIIVCLALFHLNPKNLP